MATTDIGIAIKAKNEASGTINQVKNDIGGLKSVAGGLNVGSLITGAIGGFALAGGVDTLMNVTGQIYEMGKAGDRLLDLEESFNTLSRSVGQDSGAMMASMRTASMGMISDADLVVSANKAMSLGVGESADDMAQLLKASASIAQATGNDIQGVFADLVQGIGRMSTRALTGLNINIDDAAIYDQYAASIGTVASKLDDAAKKKALFNAVMSQTANLPPPQADAADQLDTQIKNLQDNAAKATAPMVYAFAGELNRVLSEYNAQVSQVNQQQAEAADLAARNVAATELALKQGDLARQKASNDDYMLKTGASAPTEEMTQRTAELTAEITQLQAAVRAANTEIGATGSVGMTAANTADQLAQASARAKAEMTLAGYSAQAFAGHLSAVQAQAGATAGIIYNLAGAMAQLNAISNPNALARVTPSVEGMTPGLMNNMSPDEALAWQERTKAQMSEQYTTLVLMRDENGKRKYTDEQIYQILQGSVLQTQAWASGLDKVASGTAAVSQQYDDLQGKVRGVIDSALSDTGGADPSKVLPRQDSVSENARRLGAIMNEGLINQPWLEEFKAEAPGAWADLMLKVAEGTDVKTAAAQILTDFQQGLRPDLIDKGLVKERVKAMIMGDQNAAALAQEIATELAAEMNIPLSQAMAAAGSVLGVNTGGGEGAAAAGDATNAPPDMSGQGASAGTTFMAGFQTTATGTLIVATIVSQMASALPSWTDPGKNAGTTWGAGFMSSVQSGLAPQLINLLVTLVTPGVITAIQNGTSQTTPPDGGTTP